MAIQITPYLQGKMYIQTNLYYAYLTDKTVANAFYKTIYISRIFLYSDIFIGIVYLFKEFTSNWDS